jgi:solute:Na+ symporter, SSS family
MAFWDYAVMVVYMLAVVGIGWHFSKNENSTDDYLLGGRRIPWWAIAISMFASLFSALSFLGVPSEGFGHGGRMFLATFISPFAIYFGIRLFMRFYYILGSFTPYEYLEKRFNPSVRLTGSLLFMFQRGCYLAIILYASSVAFESVCGWKPWFTILIIGVLGIFYTVLGGIKAVVWTDVLQFAVFLFGLVFVVFKLAELTPGGISGGLDYAFANGRGFNFDASLFTFNPYERITIWLLLFSTFGTYFFTYSADQLNVQRILATKTYGDAKKAAYLSWCVGLPIGALLFLIGILLFSFYSTSPLTETMREIKSDKAFPNFIRVFLPTPLPGIMISALLAAIMSTLDSGMNSLSAIYVKDIYKRFIRKDATEKDELRVAKYSTMVVGLFAMIMAILINMLNKRTTTTIFEASSIWSAIVLILTAVYLLGVTTRSVSGKQINILLLLSIPIVIAASWFLYYNVEPENRISFTITGNLGGLFVLIGGYACAIFSKRLPHSQIDGFTLFTLKELANDAEAGSGVNSE